MTKLALLVLQSIFLFLCGCNNFSFLLLPLLSIWPLDKVTRHNFFARQFTIAATQQLLFTRVLFCTLGRLHFCGYMRGSSQLSSGSSQLSARALLCMSTLSQRYFKYWWFCHLATKNVTLFVVLHEKLVILLYCFEAYLIINYCKYSDFSFVIMNWRENSSDQPSISMSDTLGMWGAW